MVDTTSNLISNLMSTATRIVARPSHVERSGDGILASHSAARLSMHRDY